MSEANQPFDTLLVGAERLPVTRDNIALYRHIGANAVYDHCYYWMPDGGIAYIWIHSPIFEKYAQLIEENKARIYLNIAKPTDDDKRFYIEHATKDLIDEVVYMPLEWQSTDS